MASPSGWIRVDRKIREHWVWDDPELLRAWLWILFEATHEPRVVDVGAGQVTLATGQVLTTYRDLAEAWGWSVKKVRGFLARLVECQMVGTNLGGKGARSGTQLTVLNYTDYQQSGAQTGAEKGHKGGHASKLRKNKNKYQYPPVPQASTLRKIPTAAAELFARDADVAIEPGVLREPKGNGTSGERDGERRSVTPNPAPVATSSPSPEASAHPTKRAPTPRFRAADLADPATTPREIADVVRRLGANGPLAVQVLRVWAYHSLDQGRSVRQAERVLGKFEAMHEADAHLCGEILRELGVPTSRCYDLTSSKGPGNFAWGVFKRRAYERGGPRGRDFGGGRRRADAVDPDGYRGADYDRRADGFVGADEVEDHERSNRRAPGPSVARPEEA